MLKVTVDCNQRLQLISKVEIFSNQWFRWSKKRCVIWTYASLFACLTGLRISDILKLRWEDFEIAPDQGYCLRIRTQKTQTEIGRAHV